MARDKINLWYDREGDILEVLLSSDAGFFVETEHDDVMVRRNMQGEFVGFMIMGLSKLDEDIINLEVEPVATDESVSELP
jgi:hypothetical protein